MFCSCERVCVCVCVCVCVLAVRAAKVELQRQRQETSLPSERNVVVVAETARAGRHWQPAESEKNDEATRAYGTVTQSREGVP